MSARVTSRCIRDSGSALNRKYCTNRASHDTQISSQDEDENLLRSPTLQVGLTVRVVRTCLGLMTSMSSAGTSPSFRCGQRSSGCHRNLGPVHQQHSGWKACVGRPLDPSSAWFKVPGTWHHWSGVVCSWISSNRVATKRWNRLISFLMYWMTVVESVQNVTESMIQSSSAFTMLQRRTAIRLPTSSSLGIVGRFCGALRHLLMMSGPCRRQSFRDVPPNLAAASNTTRTFPSLFGFRTGWCGKYQVLGPFSSVKFTLSPRRCSLHLLRVE